MVFEFEGESLVVIVLWILGIGLAIGAIPVIFMFGMTALLALLELPGAIAVKAYETVSGRRVPVRDGSFWRGENSMAAQHPYASRGIVFAGLLMVYIVIRALIDSGNW